MNVSLTDELRDFVRRKVEDGEYPSELAVIEAALKRFREQDKRRGTQCRQSTTLSTTSLSNIALREGDEEVTLDEVLRGDVDDQRLDGRVIIEDERADRSTME